MVLTIVDNKYFRLGLLFCHLEPTDPLRHVIFCHRVKVAKQLGLTSLLSIDVDKVCNVCDEDEGG